MIDRVKRPNYLNPVEPNLFEAGKQKPVKGGSMGPIEFEVNDPLAPGVEPADDEVGEDSEHYDNLVAELDEKLVQRIGMQCKQWFDKDLESRSAWDSTIEKGIKTLGIHILEDEGDAPFEGACMATHPLILEAAVKFQSKATAELLPANGPVRTQVMGKQTEQALNKANRVKNFMNYQITHQMLEYYPDMERLLFYLPLYGSAFKKTYWDGVLSRPVSCFISSDNFVINNNSKSLEKARRYSEILPTISGAELKRKIIDNEYIEPKEWRNKRDNQMGGLENYDVSGDNAVAGSGIVFQTGPSAMADSVSGQVVVDGMFDKVFTIIEQHCFLSLPGVGLAGITDPYIVSFIKETGEILAIRRNWKEGDINRKKRIWYSHYSYVPGFGFYGLGLFHLLGNFQVTLTSVVRSLVDSGQFANLQGGLKLKGMRIDGDGSAIAPGEWKDVEGAIQDIAKGFFPLPYKEPSQVLFALLQWLDTRAGNFADSTEQILADSTNYGPVGTTAALLEASMKLFSAIHKRVHFSQEHDLKLLAELNFEYMPDEYPYDVPGEDRQVFKSDFDPAVVNVIPVSDPNVVSNAHRINMAQTKLQAALQNPGIHNMKKIYRDFYLTLGEEDIDNLVPPDIQAVPMSPMEDIMAMTQGKPIKAFPGQDHKSHMQFKSTWLEDPLVGGKSQTMAQLVPQVIANIREHQITMLQEQINGAVQEQGGQQLDPQVVSQIQAEAIGQVKVANEALAAMLGGNDPMQIIAQAEMLKAQTEAKRVQHVKVKDLADLSIKAQSLDIDRFLAQVKGKEVGLDASLEQFRMGMEAVKQGIENLRSEAEAKEKITQERVKTQGAAQKNALAVQGGVQKLQVAHASNNQKLVHQAQQGAIKNQLQRESAEVKLELQKKQAAAKAKQAAMQAKAKPAGSKK